MKVFFTTTLCILSLFLSAKDYKGAEIYSNESYLYGKFEMRIKAAKGSGQLSTFFLYRNNSEQSSTLWEEIDIEIFGKNTSDFQTNVIIEKVEGTKLMTEEHHSMGFDLSEDFHTFIVEWTPDSISWYVDDILIRTEKEHALSCTHPMSIRFNHWAANISNWVGYFDTSVLPSYQYVDYIKYYSYDSTATDTESTFNLEWTDDFSTFNSGRWSKANWTFGENLCDLIPANAYAENDVLVLKLHDETPPPATSIAESESTDIIAYPNPFYESVFIKESSITSDYSIYNLNGTKLFFSSDVQKTETYLQSLASGKYILQRVYGKHKVSRQVLTKQ
ncbi:MAG: family 16 glycosylhydrolase [Bacteroidales bacterium]|jgi:endo-1,3-1,4-beta-glycanase ExoK|nr:family 16 glycosylhydrolase [Bacteroidales bacterium]